MALSLNDIKNYFGGLEGVTDETLTSHLNVAKLRVKQDGVSETNEYYDLLLLYKLGDSLSSGGIINSGQITEEKVADVSIKYGSVAGTGDGAGAGETYSQAYRRVLNNILGLKERIG